MSIRGEEITKSIKSEESKKLELAETMIRKYWGHEFFRSLDGEKEIINFGKKHAEQIDMLESLVNLIGDLFLVSGVGESDYEHLYALHNYRLKVNEKTTVLSPESRRSAVLSMNEDSARLLECLPQHKLDAYMLIVHNEGVEKAEEARTGDVGIMEYSREYRKDYQPMPKTEGAPEKLSFGQAIHGGFGKAA